MTLTLQAKYSQDNCNWEIDADNLFFEIKPTCEPYVYIHYITTPDMDQIADWVGKAVSFTVFGCTVETESFYPILIEVDKTIQIGGEIKWN